MGGHHPDGHFTDLRNIIMVETSRGQRSMEASSEGGHVPKGAVVLQMEWNILQLMNIKLGIICHN